MRRGLTEELVDKLRNYELSDLPERTKVALRLADLLSERGTVWSEGGALPWERVVDESAGE